MRGLTAVLTSIGLAACAPSPTDVATVVQVVDGDTIDVSIGGRDERIRLLGVDTPEVHVPAGESAECFGAEASAFTTRQLAEGTAVRLERDVVGRDDYGRLLAYVYRVDDGAMVNELLVREGYATPMQIHPNGLFADRFVAAAVAAEAAGLGLWSACRR